VEEDMQSLKAKLAALALALPGTAAAQFIPDIGPIQWQPTLEDCRDRDYLDDASVIVQGMCSSMLADAARSAERSARYTNGVQNIETGRIEVGQGAMAEALSAKSFQSIPLFPTGTPLPADQQAFVDDGNRISSCDEYAFQRFYTYNRLKHDMEHAGSGRDAFRLAFSPFSATALGYKIGVQGQTRAAKRLRGTSNGSDQPFDPLMPLYGALLPDLGVDVFDMPKNDFFALTDEEISMVRGRASALANKIGPGRHYYRVSLNGSARGGHPNPWAWHKQMSEALADESDTEMAVLSGRRAQFQTLLGKRRAMLFSGLSRYHYKVRAVDAEIVAALHAADVEGCLDIGAGHDPANGQYDPDRCDWSPGDLLPAMVRTTDFKAHHAKMQCERFLPNPASVANGYTYRTSQGSQRTSNQDPFDNSYYMQTFLSRMAGQERYYMNQATNSSVPPVWQQSAGERWVWGDPDWAEADFGYEARWGLGDSQPRNICDVNPQLRAAAWANATVFGSQYDILDAEFDVDMRRNRRILDFELLGRDYLNYEGVVRGGVRVENDGTAQPNRNLTYNLAYDPSPLVYNSGNNSPSIRKTVSIAGFPLALQGTLSGQVGVDFAFNFNFDERDAQGNCQPTVAADVSARPFAGISAMGSVGVGISGLSGGLQVDVNLVDTALPVSADASAELDGVTGDVLIQANVDADLELRSLEGKISGYIEVPRVCLFGYCAGGRYAKTFADWSAVLEETYQLFTANWELPLQTMLTVCGNSAVECDG
jgi:hypothetical protein